MNNLEQLNDVTIPKKDKMHMVRVGQLKMIKSNQLKLQKKLQKYDFEQLATCPDSPEEKRRLLALAFLKDGKDVKEVADELKVSTQSIYNWIKRLNKDGLKGLKRANRILQ